MVDSKQFIIADTSFKQMNWEHLTLLNGKILSYHKDLNICHNSDNSVLLLGYAWSVLPHNEHISPTEFVTQSTSTITEEDIIEEEKNWCGRYILIVNDNIYLDTIGLLGVYYHKKAISSSIHILCKYLNIPVVFPNLKQGDQPPFIPGMETGNAGISRLLPSQILNIKSSQYHIRKLLPEEILKKETTEQQVECFAYYYTTSLKNLYSYFQQRNIYIALTGGRDSRATLALLEKAKLPYNIFTLQHPHISDGDIFIPPKLAKLLGKKHHFIKQFDEKDDSLYRDYHTHCSGFAFDEDWNFYSNGQYKALEANEDSILVLRSGIWSIPSSYYKYTNNGSTNFIDIFPELINKPTYLRSALEWVEYIKKDNINKDISIWDRMDWEMDTTSWLASIEQSLDIIDNIIFLQPVNSRKFLSLMYGFAEERRKYKLFEEDIANHICPQFRNVPYDYQGGYVPKSILLMRKLKYNEEVFRGKIRDFVYKKIKKQ